MTLRASRILLLVILLTVAFVIALVVRQSPSPESDRSGRAAKAARAVPVETAPIVRGPMVERRTLSGTLEAQADVRVAPKVAGRVVTLSVDLGDPVERGQVVASLDSAEYQQAVAQAEAERTVARAQVIEARNGLEIARRELKRTQALRKRGIASEAKLDSVRATLLAGEAALAVARAQQEKATAVLEAARIRLGYTQVRAEWSGGAEQRVVAERFVDEGANVSANTPLIRIVTLDPMTATIFATERDYARLKVGQEVELTTDAFVGTAFPARIARIAPVFQKGTRQARVELSVPNADHRLKPGMFIRARIVFDRVEQAVQVPEQALTRRDDVTGVFLLSPSGDTVRWQPVRTGLQDAGRVQLLDSDLTGEVVTLGQQLLDDGAAVRRSPVQSSSEARR